MDYKHEASVVFRGLVAGTIFTVAAAIMMLARCCGGCDQCYSESPTMLHRLTHILFKRLANILVVDSAALFAWYSIAGLVDRTSPLTLYTTLGSLSILILLLLTLMILLIRNCCISQDEYEAERSTGGCCGLVCLIILTGIAIFWLLVGTSVALELANGDDDDDGDEVHDGDELMSILTRLSFYMGSVAQMCYMFYKAMPRFEE